METYGDLKKAIKSIQLKQKGEKIGNVAIDVILGAIPGLGAAKSTFDVLSATFRKPDTKKSNSWLDKLDIDDEVEAIVDDTVENGFLKTLSQTFDSEPDDKPLEQDFNMNQKMVNYLKGEYKGRTVTGIQEQKSVFDKFFTKFAYKFDKGYPDMDNSTDVALLESLLSKVIGEKIILEAISKSKSIQAAQDFVDNSQFAKDNEVKKFKSGKYANRLNSSKEKDIDKIKSALKDHFGVLDSEIEFVEAGTGPASKDSMPGFKLDTEEFDEIYISVSTSKKGAGGKLNEQNFNKNINAYASKESPITVKLIGDNKTLTYDNVAEAIDVAGGTQNKLKADTALLSPSGDRVANISLKQPEGFRWASLNNDKETDFRKEFIKAAFNDPNFPITLKPNPKFPDKERYEMYKEGTDDRITLVVVTDSPYSKDPKNIFGTDDPKTVVVGKTFKPEDFKFNENTNILDVKVDHIYETMEEIDGSPFEPVFIVAQHSGNPYGLDFRSYPKFMAKLPKKGTGIEIKYSDLIK